MKFSIGEVAIVWNPTNNQRGCDMSIFHGCECEIHSIFPPETTHDYNILIESRSFRVMEAELRKPPNDEEDDSEEEFDEKYDGYKLTSWDDEGNVWRPEREVEYEQ